MATSRPRPARREPPVRSATSCGTATTHRFRAIASLQPAASWAAMDGTCLPNAPSCSLKGCWSRAVVYGTSLKSAGENHFERLEDSWIGRLLPDFGMTIGGITERKAPSMVDKSSSGMYRDITSADDVELITQLLHEAYAPLALQGMRFRCVRVLRAGRRGGLRAIRGQTVPPGSRRRLDAAGSRRTTRPRGRRPLSGPRHVRACNTSHRDVSGEGICFRRTSAVARSELSKRRPGESPGVTFSATPTLVLGPIPGIPQPSNPTTLSKSNSLRIFQCVIFRPGQLGRSGV